MNNKHKLFLVFSIFFITSCQSTTAYKNWAEQYEVPVGSKVTVNEPLTIPSRKVRAFLQDGTQTSQRRFTSGYDQYHPFCYFEVRNLVSHEQTIEPDTFTITRASRETTRIVHVEEGTMTGLSSGNGGGLTHIIELNIMRLESKSQPDVTRMVCASGFDEPSKVRLPTIDEINQALGKHATLFIVR
ncbi:MAG: hypothetical protein EP297_03870 [Gammaproteobacteria bacterium]|nr:MAG: hypothetical protein EP297_03870 [Gammaproteobacteria bacterium]